MTRNGRGFNGAGAVSAPQWFAVPATFACLPRMDQVAGADAAVVGVAFDGGSVFRAGSRFGPMAIRQASALLGTYHPAIDQEMLLQQRIVDAGDLPCNPLDAELALSQIGDGTRNVLKQCRRVLTIGGDHTITLGMLRAVRERYGPVSVVHFDAHPDCRNSYLDSVYNQGTWLRRAVEEGLLVPGCSLQVGLREPPWHSGSPQESDLGLARLSAADIATRGPDWAAEVVRKRVAKRIAYVTVDISVLDPAYAPAAATPEVAGLATHQLLTVLRRLHGMTAVAGDVVGVCPAYDHAGISSLAAATVARELLYLMLRAKRSTPATKPS